MLVRKKSLTNVPSQRTTGILIDAKQLLDDLNSLNMKEDCCVNQKWHDCCHRPCCMNQKWNDYCLGRFQLLPPS